MNLWLGLLIGLKEIWAHKFRSFLTMLGVILGVASLLSMFSLTAGIAKGMREYMKQIGGIERVGVISQDVAAGAGSVTRKSPPAAPCRRRSHRARRAARLLRHAGFDSASAAIQRGEPDLPRRGQWLLAGLRADQQTHYRASGATFASSTSTPASASASSGGSSWTSFGPSGHNYNAVGETIKINDRPFTIVGIFDYYEREEDKRRRGARPEMRKVPREQPSANGRKSSRGCEPVRSQKPHDHHPDQHDVLRLQERADVVGKEDQGRSTNSTQLTFQVADTSRFEETLDQVRTVLQQHASEHRGFRLRHAAGVVRLDRARICATRA